MFWNKNKEESVEIQWVTLTEMSQLDEILEESKAQTVFIYKHSTRCSISSMAMNRLERSWTEEGNKVKAYYLDLIRYRDISNAVAEKFGVYHESPQIIIIKNGEAVHNDSHMSISFDDILKFA
ncbi:MAG: bacillithiol system protein YtxJ [Roseivirga sp.]|jgi:bacillithiol system protein YtxJ